MSRFLALLGSIALSLAALVGVTLPMRTANAAEACQFACRITLGSNAANCDPGSGGGSRLEYTPCNTQCQNLCNGLGMGYDALHPSTCQAPTGGVTSRGNMCSPCSCIPNVATACIAASGSSYCSGQCATACSARAADVARIQGAGSSIACATGIHGTPQCVAVDQPASIRLCRACITSCVNDTTGDVQRSPTTCYATCQRADRQNACAGVSAIEAGTQEASNSAGSSGGSRPSSSGGSTGGTSGGSAPAPSGSTGGQGTEGTCRFNCQPQVPPTTCNTVEDCATPCQQICGRSFRNGTCVTSGPRAARCAPVGTGTTKQCIFECSIGNSVQERTCNPQGANAQAPGTVCGHFCEESCRSAATQRPATEVRFCAGSAPTCVGAGGAGPNGSTGSSDSSSGSSGDQTSGAAPGARLTNPLPGIDSIAGLVGRLVKGILGVVGSVALLMFTYGGIKWILSAGDPKEVTNAQHILRNATIGLVLIFFSYSISSVIIGFLEEVGTGSSGNNSSASGSTDSSRLATCVEYAVTHGHIGRNEARDRTAPNWACRETQVAERNDRSVCILRGCPNDGPTVLCCAPVGGSAGSAGETAGSGTTGASGTAPAAAAGCQTTVAASFHLRPTETAESTGASIAAGARVQVIRAGTIVRSGTLIHNVQVIGGASGWMFLTGSEVAACRAPGGTTPTTPTAPTTPTTPTTPAAAAPGCRTRIAASFHLRTTETAESTGASIPSGTSVDVIRAGTLVRNGTLIHNVRVVGGATGWAFLTGPEVAACRAP